MAAYDLVVVGAGSAGLLAAPLAAKLGARVALVEKDRPGGDCLFTGCVPSKTLVKVAKVAWEMRTAGRFGDADHGGREPSVRQRERAHAHERHGIDAELQHALDGLVEELRSVVILNLVEGHTHIEIGEILGIPEGTSKARLSRARAQLREALADLAPATA